MYKIYRFCFSTNVTVTSVYWYCEKFYSRCEKRSTTSFRNDTLWCNIQHNRLFKSEISLRRQENDYFLRSLDCDTIYVLAKNEKKNRRYCRQAGSVGIVTQLQLTTVGIRLQVYDKSWLWLYFVFYLEPKCKEWKVLFPIISFKLRVNGWTDIKWNVFECTY